MIRLKLWRALALAVFAAAALPAHAGEVYQISTISSLLAGGTMAIRPSPSCSAMAASDWGLSTEWTGR